MDSSIPENFTQCTFDFDTLSTQPVEDFPLSVNPVLPQKETYALQEQQPRKEFFTYRLIRSDTGLPFYIGKGCGRRDRAHEENAKNHRKDCNHRVCNTIRKLWREGHRVIRERIAENITEASAFALEKFFVSLGAVYGWPLCNHTNGGEGASGYRWTEEQRAMRREVALRELALHPERRARLVSMNIGRVHSAEVIQKRGKSIARALSSPEWKQGQGKRMKTNWQDEEFRTKVRSGLTSEARERINANRRGKPNDNLAKTYPGFISPKGIIHEQVSNLHAFCQEHNLQVSNMCLIAQGKQYAHKGWTCYPPIEKPAKKPMPPKTAYTGFVSPDDGQIYHVTTTLKDFCKEHGLTLGAMSNVNAGKWPSHKGWTKYRP